MLTNLSALQAPDGVLAESERQLRQTLPIITIVANVASLFGTVGFYLWISQENFVIWMAISQLCMTGVALYWLHSPPQRAHLAAHWLYFYYATVIGLYLWFYRDPSGFVQLAVLSVATFYFVADRRYLLITQLYGCGWLLANTIAMWSDPLLPITMVTCVICWAGGLAIHIGRVSTLKDLEQTRRALYTEIEVRRQAQEKSLIQQKHESLGTMASSVAHDLNNMLTGIVGGTDLAERSRHKDTDWENALKLIRSSSTAAQALCNSLLDYSGGKSPVFEPIDLNVIVSDALQLTATGVPPSISITTDLSPVIELVNGDRSQIEQAVVNLITNAAEAMQDKSGEIKISTRVRTDASGQTRICICVEDEGPGMSPEVRERMFDPYFTTKPTGRGLGLASVMGTINSHGGEAVVNHETGKTGIELQFPPLDVNALSGEVAGGDMEQSERSEERSRSDEPNGWDSSPYLVFYKDTQNRTVRVNRTVAELRGLTPEDMADTDTAIWHPDEASDYYQDDLEVISSGQPKIGIRELIEFAPNKKRPFRTDKIPTFDSDGKVNGVIVIAQPEPVE